MCLGVQWGQRLGGEQAAPAGAPVTSSFPSTQWWQFRRSPSRQAHPVSCAWGCSFPVPSRCCWGLFALCECQQGQMFASAERAGHGSPICSPQMCQQPLGVMRVLGWLL